MSESTIQRDGGPGSADDGSSTRAFLHDVRSRLEQLRAAPRRTSLQRVLEIVAVSLVPLGVGLIILGWFGAANTVLIEEQIPYLISGGLLGVGLLIGGGLLYVGSWISRLAGQNREQADALRQAIEGVREEIRSLAALERAAAGASAATLSGNGSTPVYVATPNGTMFHRPDCGVVADRDDLREVDAEDTDLTPCGICEPMVGTAPEAPTT